MDLYKFRNVGSAEKMKFNCIRENVIDILARTLSQIKKNLTIEIVDLVLDSTEHSEQQKFREDNFGQRTITDEEITHTVSQALSQIMNDFSNGEIDNHKKILIKNKDTFLNIVCVLHMQKGQDVLKIVTVMRKEKFIPKEDTEKTYEV